MTSQLLEPELEELLRTVAADPRSTLLRVDRPSTLRGFFDRNPQVSEACTQLTSAERQLLRVHRHSLAELLCRASFDLLTGNTHNYFLCLDQGEGGPQRPPSLQSEDTEKLRNVLAVPGRWVKEAVARAVSSTNPLCYAALACRIAPNVSSYLYLSDSYQLLGESEFERRAVEHAAQLVTNRKEQAHVLSYQGFHFAQKKDLATAIWTYRTAYRIGGKWPSEVMSWLALSVQCRDETLFRGALDAMEETPITPTTIRNWTSDQDYLRRAGFWSRIPGSQSFWRDHSHRAGEGASYVLDTLFLS